MKIIVLAGPNSCGKTSTLNIVYNLLFNDGGVPTNRKQLGANPNDFLAIIEWKGKKIAIFTMGDYSGELVRATKEFASLNCDLMICACNARLVKPFEEFAKHNTKRIDKNKEYNIQLRQITDNNTAQTIFNLI